MKRFFALAVVVGISGIIAAAALPRVDGPPRADALAIVEPPIAEVAPVAGIVNAISATLVIPDIVITVPRPQDPVHVMRHSLQTPRSARDLYEMRCSEWVDFSESLEGRHMQRCD